MKQQITKYLFMGLLTCLTIAGSGYSYMHFKIQQAYKDKNYQAVYEQLELLKPISSHAIDIGIKSTLEHSIYTLKSKNTYQFINPADSLIANLLIKNAQITSSPHNTKWQPFYDHYMHFITNLPSNESTQYLEKTPYLYTPFINIVKNLEFREKETYIDACYGYSVSFHLEQISQTFINYIKYNYFFVIPENNQNKVSNSLSIIKKQLDLIDSTPNKYISKLYYNDIQYTFLKNIDNINQHLSHKQKYKSYRKTKRKIKVDIPQASKKYIQKTIIQIYNLHLYALPKIPYQQKKATRELHEKIKLLIDAYKN